MLGSQPDIPWTQIARDHLAHRYFDTDHAVLQAILDRTGAPQPWCILDEGALKPSRFMTVSTISPIDADPPSLATA
jgi:hypothetical protein